MIDTTMLLWSLLFGSIGFGYFIYGKKQSNIVARYTGVLLMIYPYFVTSAVLLVIIGVLLMLVPKFVEL